MNEPLRPMSLGEVLDRTAQLYRARFLIFFGIGALPTGAVLVFFAAFFAILAWTGSNSAVPHGQIYPSPAAAIVAMSVVGVVGLIAVPAFVGATALEWAAMCHAAAALHLGESTTIRAAYKFAWQNGWRHVGLFLLITLAVGVAPSSVFFGGTVFASVLSLWAGNAGRNEIVALAGFLIFALVVTVAGSMIWLLLRLALGFPACVVERINAWSAVKRSWVLSNGTKGRVFLLSLLGTALNWILALGFSLPAMILIALVPGLRGPQHAQMLGMIVIFLWYGISFTAQIFVKPIFGIGLTLFYFDQRIRKEGFDIEWMMQEAGMVHGPPLQAELQPWLPAPARPAPHQPEAVEAKGSPENSTGAPV